MSKLKKASILSVLALSVLSLSVVPVFAEGKSFNIEAFKPDESPISAPTIHPIPKEQLTPEKQTPAKPAQKTSPKPEPAKPVVKKPVVKQTTPAKQEVQVKKPAPTKSDTVDKSTMNDKSFEEIIKPLLGKKYQWGGTSEKGFDASGFVQYVYGKKGISLPRTTEELRKLGTEVKDRNWATGDLVFFASYEKDTRGKHVGIALDKNRVAITTIKNGVTIVDLTKGRYWTKSYRMAKRVL